MHEPDTSGVTRFERNRASSIPMLGISAVFIALGAWFLFAPETFAGSGALRWLESLGIPAEGAAVAVGLLSLGLGGLGAFAWMRHRQNPAPVAVLSPKGLSVDAGPLKMTDLPWSEVTGTVGLSIAGTEMLGVRVRDPDAVLATQRGFARVTGRANAKLYQTPVYVANSMIQEPLDELAIAVEAYRERYGAA